MRRSKLYREGRDGEASRLMGPGGLGDVAGSSTGREYAMISPHTLEDRIGRLFRAVTEGYVEPEMRMAAARAVSACRSRDWECEIHAAFDSVKDAIPYRYDPEAIDIYASLPAALEGHGGDCGTHTVAHCTVLGLLGYKVGALALAQGNEYRHVMAVAVAPVEPRGEAQKLVFLDSTEDWTGPWWKPASFNEASLYWYDPETWVSWRMRGGNDAAMPRVVRSQLWRGSVPSV